MLKAIPILFLLTTSFSFPAVPADKDSKQDSLALVNNFISSLDTQARGKAILPFDSPGRWRWARSPERREGLAIKEMSAEQRQLLDKILQSALSEEGFRRAKAIMSDQDVLGEQEEGLGRGYYWLAIYGEPGQTGRWAWRLGGHHLSLHFTYADNRLISTAPTFLGAQETLAPNSPREVGYKMLLTRRDLAHALVKSLNQPQSKRAIIAETFSSRLIISEARQLVLSKPNGLPISELDEKQKAAFLNLIKDYTDVFAAAQAREQLEKMKRTPMTEIYFASVGIGADSSGPDYYRIQGPDFLIEYSDSGKHIHSIWRGLDDFGER